MINTFPLLFSALIGICTGILYGVLFTKPLNSLFKMWLSCPDIGTDELTPQQKFRFILHAVLWFFVRFIIIGLSLFFLLVKVRVHATACVLFFCLGFWFYILKSTKAS